MKKNKPVVQLFNKINQSIIYTKKIKKKKKILISISGGQDSICLFFIFIHLKKQWKWCVGIIYCNHLWQVNSFYSGSLVIKLAYLFLIPIYYTISSDKIFKEKNSRYWRYGFFYRLSFFYDYKIIYTGHTITDKIETSLFQNIRGSSLKSLLCLHDIKYFYSNNKFTKNIEIKTTKFYNRYILNKHTKTINKYMYCYCIKNFFCYSIIVSRQTNWHVFRTLKLANLPAKQAKFKLSDKKIIFYKNYLKKNNIYLPFPVQQQITKNFSKKKWNNKKYSNNLPSLLFYIARPILLLNRFDLKKLSLFLKLPLYPDISNKKKNYYRNRIRKDLLPTLKFFFNPQIEKSLFQFEEIRLQEQFILNLLLKRLIVEFYSHNTKNSQLNISFLRNIPLSIQRKLIHIFLKKSLSTQIQFITIQNTIKLFEKNLNYKYSLSNYQFFLNNYKLKKKNNYDKKLRKMPFWFLNQFKNIYFLNSNNPQKKKQQKKQKLKIWILYSKKKTITKE